MDIKKNPSGFPDTWRTGKRKRPHIFRYISNESDTIESNRGNERLLQRI